MPPSNPFTPAFGGKRAEGAPAAGARGLRRGLGDGRLLGIRPQRPAAGARRQAPEAAVLPAVLRRRGCHRGRQLRVAVLTGRLGRGPVPRTTGTCFRTASRLPASAVIINQSAAWLLNAVRRLATHLSRLRWRGIQSLGCRHLRNPQGAVYPCFPSSRIPHESPSRLTFSCRVPTWKLSNDSDIVNNRNSVGVK